MLQIKHLALFVPDLRAAEAWYAAVFDMGLLFREARLSDGAWYTLRPGTGWDEAAPLDIEEQMAALGRNGFTLALFRGAPSASAVVEIGVHLLPEEIAALRRRLPPGLLAAHEHGDLMFDDPFGFRWHVEPAGTAFVSNAALGGRWLNL